MALPAGVSAYRTRGHFDHAAFWDALSASRRVGGVEASRISGSKTVSYFPAPKTFNSFPNLPTAHREDTIDPRLEFDLPVLPTLPAADLLNAGQVDCVVAMDAEVGEPRYRLSFVT